MPIDLHRFVVFCHVVGMVGIVAGVTIEWISIPSLVPATTYEEAKRAKRRGKEWHFGRCFSELGVSYLLVLASGIYLAASLAAWQYAWAAIAVPTLVVVAIAGAAIGPRLGRIREATATGIGPLSNDAHL